MPCVVQTGLLVEEFLFSLLLWLGRGVRDNVPGSGALSQWCTGECVVFTIYFNTMDLWTSCV